MADQIGWILPEDYNLIPDQVTSHYLVDAAITAEHNFRELDRKQTLSERLVIDFYAAINVLMDNSLMDRTMGHKLVADLRTILHTILGMSNQ